MPEINEIIDELAINNALSLTTHPLMGRIEGILKKASLKKGLDLLEVASLLNIDDGSSLTNLFNTAARIKQDIYGERVVLFAPLYVSNYCVNDCEYCGFHCRNNISRKKLDFEEIEEQVKILINMGHKRLLLEFGEDPTNNPIDYVTDVIKKIYSVKTETGEIRRVNVNIAATNEDNYQKLKKAGIGTYQLFQETYHWTTYQKLHRGPKVNFSRQLFAHDRAMAAGLDDLGLGVLFGLYNYKFEVLALIAHAQYLDKKYGVGPHTFSVPRMQPAETVDMPLPYAVSEAELLKIIAILRLAVPYTGMIISTREKPEIRQKAFKIGISQTSAASRTAPGGYGLKENLEQFAVADERSVDDVILGLLEQDLLPSFCTACYRKGRTGEAFMELAKPGNIHNLCRPNAILTFQEYLEDYASDQVCSKGVEVINRYLGKIDNLNIREKTVEKLKRIREGIRDLYF